MESIHELKKLKKALVGTSLEPLSARILEILWKEFSNIQAANCLGVKECDVKRFVTWIGSGNDDDAWS